MYRLDTISTKAPSDLDKKEIKKENVLRFLQWIVIAIYFWGGFNKLNIAFAWEIFPWFTQHLGIGENYFLGMDNLNTFPMPSENNIAFFNAIADLY